MYPGASPFISNLALAADLMHAALSMARCSISSIGARSQIRLPQRANGTTCTFPLRGRLRSGVLCLLQADSSHSLSMFP